MRYYFLFIFLLIGLGMSAQTYSDTTKVNVVENGSFIFRTTQEFIDSSDIAQHNDTLTTLATKTDVVDISNTIILTVDSIEQILTKSYDLNDLIKDKQNGGLYQIQTDSVAGYATDSVAVIPNGGNYAVLQPVNGQYDVRWFGAVGDSLTDDTEKIQNGINYSTEEVLLFSPGYYMIEPDVTSALSIPSNTHIKGTKGSVLKFLNEATIVDTFNTAQNRWDVIGGSVLQRRYYQMMNIGGVADVDNVTIEGLEFDGNNKVQYYRPIGGITWWNVQGAVLFDAQNYSIFVGDNAVTNLTIRDCYFHDMFGDGASIRFADNVVYDNIRMKDMLRQGIGISTGSSNVKIQRIEQLANVNVLRQGGNTVHAEPSSTVFDIVVSEITGTRGLSMANVEGLSISQCIIDSAFNIQLNTSSNIVLSNNIIKGGKIEGVQLGKNINIFGNNVHSDSLAGINVQFIDVASAEDAIINGNTIECLNEGIQIIHGDDVIIKGNVIRTFDFPGIYTQDCKTAIISNNIVDTSSASSIQSRSISITRPATVIVEGNIVSGNINMNDVDYAAINNRMGGTVTESNSPTKISINSYLDIIQEGVTGFPTLNLWRDDAPLLSLDGVINYRSHQAGDIAVINLEGLTNSGAVFGMTGSSGQGIYFDLDKDNLSNFEQFVIEINGGTAEWFRIQKSGNYALFDNSLSLGVGIVPTEKLHVNGNLLTVNEGYFGNITDQGAYNLQVEGNAYFDDQVTITNTPGELGDSVLVSGTGNVVAATSFADLASSLGSSVDHGGLTGLGDDDHTQYPLLLGRGAGQTLIGGTTTTADLSFQTTSGIGATGADMHFLVGNNGATGAMTILNNGEVLIGTTDNGVFDFQVNGDQYVTGDINIGNELGVGSGVVAPGAGVDIVNATEQLRLSNTTNDVTTKLGKINVRHETNLEEDVSLIAGSNTSSANIVGIGGGMSALNAATEIQFYTAANNTTLNGTERMSIETDGEVLIGIADQGVYNLQVEGNSYFDDNVTVAANTIFDPSATTSITAGGGITVLNTIMRVDGSAGPVNITANPQIADGTDGQIVMIKGQNDTNTVTLDDGTGLQLAGAAAMVLGLGDIITFMYDSVDDLWIEISRSDN